MNLLRKGLNLLRGLNSPPALVRAARSVVEVGIMAGLTEAALLFPTVEWSPKLLPFIGVGFALIKMAEGWADQIDPEKVRRS